MAKRYTDGWFLCVFRRTSLTPLTRDSDPGSSHAEQKLVQARNSGAVVVSAPKSLKSFRASLIPPGHSNHDTVVLGIGVFLGLGFHKVRILTQDELVSNRLIITSAYQISRQHKIKQNLGGL